MELWLFILGSMVVALAATGVHALFRKRAHLLPLTEHNEVTAAVYATFGVLYAVILGLLVSHGQTRRDLVSEASVRESALLVDVAQLATAFDSAMAQSLTQACLRYSDHVRTVEWRLGAQEDHMTGHRIHLASMWRIVRSIEPVGARQESVYMTLLERMSDLSSERYERQAATGDHMSMFLKVVLLIGGAVTVLFLWFFGMQQFRIHLAYTWLVTFMLALVLALIFALDDPLRPGVGVEPSDFERASNELRAILAK
ncbi:MAG: DUF4239 domain-containing protein [Candidatus Kapabacteria bacterium]|nr:DUF4239 domain-containing protein [Candidatus Kapabacteria bacterium]